MTIPAEDFDRLKKNVHAINTGAAKIGDVHNPPANKPVQNETLKAASDMVHRFYPKSGKP